MPGVRYCAVSGCKNNARDNPNLSFFRFPKEHNRCNIWIANSRRTDLSNKGSAYCFGNMRLCSVHFENKAFSSMLKNQLKTDAIPTLFSFEDSALPDCDQLEDSIVCRSSVKPETATSTVQDTTTETASPEHVVIYQPQPSCSFHSATPPEAVVCVQGTTETATFNYLDGSEPQPSCSSHSPIQNPICPVNEVATQTSKVLSRRSPRKILMRKKLRSFQRQADRKRLFASTPAKMTEQQLKEYCDNHFGLEAASFIKAQLQLWKLKPKGRRYTQEMLQFALTVHFLSPLVYAFFKKLFRLPSKATLLRMTSKWPITSGLCDYIFTIVQNKMSHLNMKAKDCIVCIDEMSLKSNLFYNRSKDEIIGFHKLNGYTTYNPANSALVVMARGIHVKWKQPIAYFLINNSCSGEDLKQIIFSAVGRLQNIGLNVLAVVSDQGSNFYQFCSSNVTIEKPYFFVNNKKVFYMFDVPHLMKSVRNNFFVHHFRTNSGTTDKKYLTMFYEADSKLSLRLAPKLTEQHINSNNFQKMKVKLAVQIFSATVTAAINTYMSLGAIPLSAKATIDLLDKCDKLFDLFNSSYYKGAKKFNFPFMGLEYQISFLHEMTEFFKTLRVINKSNKDVTNSMRFIYGWQLTISAFLQLWEVVKAADVKVLFTRRLNQDALENFFGKIRQQSGNCINPTPIQFSRAFKKLFCLDYFIVSKGFNCIYDFDRLLAAVTPEEVQHFNVLMPKEHPFKNLTLQSNDHVQLDFPERNALKGSKFSKGCLSRCSS